MAPSPENDNAPKAPDKTKQTTENPSRDKDKDESVSNLNEGELKALLDEAITYKNPKDREGKSELFKDLLNEAEETERIMRAKSAGGSDQARHCNSSAKKHGRHHRRKPSSISENMMHGGSLDNLAKEEYDSDRYLTPRTRKSVSARQREGGSLPCNVNSSSLLTGNECQFLEEARQIEIKNATEAGKPEFTAIDMESESLLENDSLALNYLNQEQHHALPVENMAKYTSKATLQVNIDDPIQIGELEEKRPFESYDFKDKVAFNPNVLPKSIYSEEKKVDENGNLHHTTGLKSKKKKNKNEVTISSETILGHRGDIINNVDELMKYIGGDNNCSSATKSRSVKSKQLHKNTSEDSGRGKKQRAQASKGKETRPELKKSNSLGEISTSKMDEFSFDHDDDKNDEGVVMRTNKTNSGDRPRERRSWGTVEPPSFQYNNIYSNISVENLETLENWVVTKPKKKSKKRRNSMSSSRRQTSTSESHDKHVANRAASPDLRKSASSVPHSEKSNDSSDADSIHSLPIDGLNTPISYADIAKNSEKPKEKKGGGVSAEKQPIERVPNKEKATLVSARVLDFEPVLVTPKCESKSVAAMTMSLPSPVDSKLPVVANVAPIATNIVKSLPLQPPDVHNIKSFPAIPSNNVVVVATVGNNKVQQVVPPPISVVNKANNNVNTKNNNISNKVKNNSVCKMVKSPEQCVLQNDIQTDLSIIQANEKDSIQFNAHMLPPDIPDVQTIEKLHFMNHHHPNNAATATTTILMPNNYNQLNNNVCLIDNNTNSANCDNSDNRTNNGLDERPPPVVILSGIGNKEVSGLVFGFDVNEQLLSEDICENFTSKFIVPEVFNHASHNHDKIVHFVAASWESVMNQPSSKVSYYTDGL